MSSYTASHSSSFTITHARHMAAKVAADLKRIQRFYGQPTDTQIASYEAEIVDFLRAGYLGQVTYGYQRNGQWIEPSLHYTAKDLAGADGYGDDPGKIVPGKDVTNATFTSFLIYSSAWSNLSAVEQEAFGKGLPFSRTDGPTPTINGYLVPDRTYTAGGKALDRSSVRSSS